MNSACTSDKWKQTGKELHQKPGPLRPLWLRILQRIFILSIVWWVISDRESASWIMGIPAIALAIFVAMVLPPPEQCKWRIRGALRFIPIFFVRSLRGGVDVAIRALHPRMPLYPGLVHYSLRLKHRSAQIFLVNTVSLMPGTLSVELEEDCLTLQALDIHSPIEKEIREMETLIAAIFGIHLEAER